MNFATSIGPAHLLESRQFNQASLKALFALAATYKSRLRHDAVGLQTTHAGRMVSLVFYEPSTRTRFSFSHAAKHLGMLVHETENAADFSSAAKGETIEDTVRVLMGYGSDVIVLRHGDKDGPARAAAVSQVPIVNAGAGSGEHPSQALLDLFTIEERMGKIDGLTVVIGGDLAHGRTARSLAFMLGLYRPAHIIFVAPTQARMGDDVKAVLTRSGIAWSETETLQDALPLADVVYWTRIQQERMDAATFEAIKDLYILGTEEVAMMPEHAILMHPLPRVGEIRQEVDRDPRAWYFEQAHNGVPVRMAALTLILNGMLFVS